MQSVISGYNGTQPESNLTKQDSEISWKDFKEIQNNFSVPWTQSQMYTLVKQKLGKKVSMQSYWKCSSHVLPLDLDSLCHPAV